MNYLTETKVRIVEHPSKQFLGKIGILDTEIPDTKKPGRFPVQIDEIGKIAWCKLDWLEVIATESEPSSEVDSISDASANTDELLASGDSEPEAIAEEPVTIASKTESQTGVLLMDDQDSDRPQSCVDSEVSEIELNRIELSGGTQSRAGFDEATLAEYTEAWERGVKFPPVDLYYDGKSYWLSDGFHRVLSCQRAKLPGSTIAATIHQGTRRDAVLASVGANATHGLKRGNADKRRAVETLLRDQEWGQWSDNAIAKACGVSQPFVGKMRTEIFPTYNGYKSERKALDGRTLNTAKIGRTLTPPGDERTFNSVVQETNAKLNQLVKPLNAEQVGYDYDRNEAPAQVDDRPFATLLPPLVTTAAAVSSWDEAVQFTVTVGYGIPIQVKYEPFQDGERHLLNFTGPVDRSGERAYYLLPDRALEEGTPQVLAQQLAENFYHQLQTASPQLMKTLDDSASEAIAPSIEEYLPVVEETEALKAERDELKQRLAEANTVIERLKQEVQELQGQLRMSA